MKNPDKITERYLQATTVAVILPFLLISLPFTALDYTFLLVWFSERIGTDAGWFFLSVIMVGLPPLLVISGLYLLYRLKQFDKERRKIRVGLYINIAMMAIMALASGILVSGQLFFFGQDSRNLARNEPFAFKAYSLIDISVAWDAINTHTQGQLEVQVGIIDTGIDASGSTDRHQEFLDVPIAALSLDVLEDDKEGGHGTQVSGIIGANNLSFPNPEEYEFPHMNGILSGVHNLDYTLIVGKKPSTSLTLFTLANTVDEMDRRGASIINMSFANPIPLVSLIGKKAYSRIFERKPDTLFIVPAGQLTVFGYDLPAVDTELITPANFGDNFDNVITVGATDITDGFEDTRISFSNFGSAVNISAPGIAVYSPAPRGEGNYPSEDSDYDLFFTGTSASAPMVTGVAGLIKAINPLLTPAQIKQIITTTADPIFTTDINEITKTLGSACDDGSPNFRGCRLNALAAVCHPLVLDCTPLQAAPLWSTFQNDAQHTGRSSLVGHSFATTSDVTVKWQATLDGPTEIQPLIGGDGTVYTLTAHTLQSFNGDTGAFLAATTTPGVSQSFALGPDNTVYVCSRATGAPITAYTPDLGEKKWTFFIGGSRECLPPIVSSDNIIYATVPPPTHGQTAVLAAINSDGTERFRYEEPNIAATSPALSKDETIVYVAFNKTLRAFSSKTTVPTPAPIWTQTDSFRFSFAPLIDDNDHIIMTDTDIGFRAYDMDGTVLWTRPIGNNLQNPPTLDQNGNILFSRTDTLFTINPADGEITTTTFLPDNLSGRNRTSVDGNNRKYVIADKATQSLLAIDADIVWEFSLANGTEAPAIGDGILYIVSDNVLYALGE